MTQQVIETKNSYAAFDHYIKEKQIQKIFLVCGKSSDRLPIGEYLSSLEGKQEIEIFRFRDFQPNPEYESVEKGVCAFLLSKAECIMAIGGGSAMDVAKCIKAFATLNQETDFLKQSIMENDIPFIAVPTTAGTGSEATHFAVIYRNGEKLSIAHKSLVPELVVMDAENLKTLPLYQRQATMLDALCHAIEACWSVNAIAESDAYAKTAIKQIMQCQDAYLQNEDDGNERMLKAAYYAGKAINITKTTAAHAMSYKLTSMYGIAHGHAAAVCLSKVWEHLLGSSNEEKIAERLQIIAEAMGCNDSYRALQFFRGIIDENKLHLQKNADEKTIELLADSVNVERLNNHPVTLSKEELRQLYRDILS